MNLGLLKQRFVDCRIPDRLRVRRERSEYDRWVRLGQPVPPPEAFKHLLLMEYGRRFSLGVFIETGTYLGDTVFALRDTFRRIFSIELSPELAARAVRRFAHLDSITVVTGDSANVLPDLLSDVTEPALFWLDGHYSGGITARGEHETPVVQELRAVLGHPVSSHVILIDDARLFVGEGDYPSLDTLREFVRMAGRGYVMEVRHDVIRIHRPPAGDGEC